MVQEHHLSPCKLTWHPSPKHFYNFHGFFSLPLLYHRKHSSAWGNLKVFAIWNHLLNSRNKYFLCSYSTFHTRGKTICQTRLGNESLKDRSLTSRCPMLCYKNILFFYPIFFLFWDKLCANIIGCHEGTFRNFQQRNWNDHRNRKNPSSNLHLITSIFSLW